MNVPRAAALCAALIPAVLNAQAAAPPAPPASALLAPASEALGSAKTAIGTSVACFGRMTTQQEHPSVPFRVVVPLNQVEAVTKQGFTRIDCAGREKKLSGYKRMVCEMAASGNDAVQARLKSVIGFEPATLCNTAKKIAPEPGDDKLGPEEIPGLTDRIMPSMG